MRVFLEIALNIQCTYLIAIVTVTSVATRFLIVFSELLEFRFIILTIG